eukprot:XP_001704882.1 Hypothetical protein GL50803_37276 [Giardia lamblia ATCC 50803]
MLVALIGLRLLFVLVTWRCILYSVEVGDRKGRHFYVLEMIWI